MWQENFTGFHDPASNSFQWYIIRISLKASSGEVSYIKMVECDHELHGTAKFEEAETNKPCATTLLRRFYAAFSNHYVLIETNLLCGFFTGWLGANATTVHFLPFDRRIFFLWWVGSWVHAYKYKLQNWVNPRMMLPRVFFNLKCLRGGAFSEVCYEVTFPRVSWESPGKEVVRHHQRIISIRLKV